MKLLSTASMITLVTMASAKKSMLRQTHLGAAAGTSNYKHIAHITFNGEDPPQFRFSEFAINATTNFSDTTTTTNWTSTDDYIDGRDFYFDYPDGVENTAGVFFEFGQPGDATNYIINLAEATADGPKKCNDPENLIWDDVDKLSLVRDNVLFSWDDGVDVGTELEFQCWPAKSNYWVDESDSEDFVATAAADQSGCKGRKADLEKYIVVTLGRDHDAQCDWVAACKNSSATYGEYCIDPLNKDNYPNNECNICKDCTNPCNTTFEWFDTKESNCGKDRKNAETTLNKQNEYSLELCRLITTRDANTTVYIKTQATPTSDNVFETCPATKKCDGSATTPTDCPATATDNFYNDGTGYGCVASGVGFETNINKTGVTECAEGKFATATSICTNSGINKQPKIFADERTGEVEACAAGEVALADAKCSKCAAGKYAGSDDNTTEYQLGQCNDCLNNTYSAAGATECSTCPARHVASTTDGVPCERCEIGQVVKNGECKKVAVGKYQQTGSDTEFVCGDDSMTTYANGVFNDGEGSAGCKPCDEYDPENDGSEYYQAAANSYTECVLIPAGKERFNNNNNSLVDCPAGEYSAKGDANCQKCPKGKYSGVRAGECTACVEGKFSEEEGSAECKSPDDGYKSTDKISQVYCEDGFYSNDNNRTLCIARTTSLNEKATGTSPTRIRIKFNLDKNHIEVDRVRCGTEEERDGERPVQGTDLLDLVADSGGATGRCRCRRPFGQAASVTGEHFETDETTGCANDKGQCVGRLSCEGSCNRQDRSNPAKLKCEVVYARANVVGGSMCVGYHGNIPTKWSETWTANAADVTCDEAVVSTLPALV